MTPFEEFIRIMQPQNSVKTICWDFICPKRRSDTLYSLAAVILLLFKTCVLSCIRLWFNSLYSLIPGAEECFEVDRRSGEIRTTGRALTPSREYVLRVRAVEAGAGEGLTATVSVLAGFRPPQFTNVTYSLSVAENTPPAQP